MIKEFVDIFQNNSDKLREVFKLKHPGNYENIVKSIIELIASKLENYDSPDPERIHVIDDGDYQGTLLFVIAGKGYQPSNYWYVKVGYGSCSGCDTLESIRSWPDDGVSDEQVKDYMQLALNIVQELKPMQEINNYHFIDNTNKNEIL
jgi:hypothetical protein